jgi:polar amino acid transport system substrate-binding protein
MRTFANAIGLILLILVFVGMVTPASAQNALIPPAGNQQTVTLACNPFPPSKIAPDAALPGYDVEILRAAFATRNITLITPFYPWRRAYFLARTGEVDGLCSCSYLPEREEDLFYSYLLGHVGVAFYAIGENALTSIEKIADARNMIVGVVNGYSLEAAAREAGIDVLVVNSEATLLDMLLSRRLDAALSYKVPMDFEMHRSERNLAGVGMIHTKVISSNPYFSCISRKARNPKALLDELNKGLVAIRENGLFDQILARYGFAADRSLPLKD